MIKRDCYQWTINTQWENATVHQIVGDLVAWHLSDYGVTHYKIEIEPPPPYSLYRIDWRLIGEALGMLANEHDLTWDIEGDTLVMRWDAAKRDRRLDMKRRMQELWLRNGG